MTPIIVDYPYYSPSNETDTKANFHDKARPILRTTYRFAVLVFKYSIAGVELKIRIAASKKREKDGM